ncbi:MAG: HDOD domain-containing protein, partial [Desulfobacterales bacterium]
QKANYQAKDPQLQELMRGLWRHSVACAFGAKWLAKKCGFADIVQDAFLAGLLHDIGSLFISTVIDDIRRKGKIENQIAPALIQEVIRTLHPRLGHSVMKAWNLPEKFCLVARDHHTDPFDTKNYLLTVVRLANKTCNKMGIGLDPQPDLMLTATQEAMLLGLSEVDIAELEVRLEDAANLILSV